MASAPRSGGGNDGRRDRRRPLMSMGWGATESPLPGTGTGRNDIDQDQTGTTTMTDPTIPVTEDELHAYVDNELPAERRGDVEAWLAAHPDDAGRVQSWRAMAEALHARYDQG